jgi:hypothetical protein
MKKLFTGYFGAAKKYPESALQVRIASMAPQWWGAKLKSYQPKLVWRSFKVWKQGLFKGDMKADYFEQMDLLKNTGELQTIIDSIPDQSILLCYEKDVCTCHRGWLLDYLVKNEMAEVSEFPLPPAEKREMACGKVIKGQTDLLFS